MHVQRAFQNVSAYTKTTAYAKAGKTYVVPHARNSKQGQYIQFLQDDMMSIVIASGSAGSGKTALATHVGVHKLKNNHVKRLIITRPAICVDEEHGFLPGTLEQKMEPWLRPVFDVLHKHYQHEQVKQLIANKTIELCPLAFMRGRTFEKSWIICDEAQNCTPNQMLMVMTRMGIDSKLVVTGDPTQFDRGFETNGLSDVLERMKGNPVEGVAVLHFTGEDVVRHHIIPKILDLYDSSSPSKKYEQGQ